MKAVKAVKGRHVKPRKAKWLRDTDKRTHGVEVAKHSIRVVTAPPGSHQVTGILGSMFFPRCRCGWEGAFMVKAEDALAEGHRHHKEVK